MCAAGCVHRDEIQRIKAGNPDITHREAFSAAAKNVTFFFLPRRTAVTTILVASLLSACLVI